MRFPLKTLFWLEKSWLVTVLAFQKGDVNPCPAQQIKMPRLFLVFSQSDYLIQNVDISSHT